MKNIKILSLIACIVLGIGCSKLKLELGNEEAPTTELSSLKEGKVLATVNGTEIREGYLELLARVNPRVKGQLSNPQGKEKMLDSLVEQELLYQESVKRGLDKQASVKEKAALYKRVIISQELLSAEMAVQAKDYYEKNKEIQFTKLKVAQIQVNFKQPETAKPVNTKLPANKKSISKDAKEANAPATVEEKAIALKKIESIKARLDAGEDFAKLAEEASDDNLSKKKGGEIGEVSRDDKRLARMDLSVLAETAFTLKNGEVSKPIETKNAYYIIKVTSDPTVTPFEEAEKTINFQLQQEIKNNLLANLKKSANISIKKTSEEAPAPSSPTTLSDTPTTIPAPQPDQPIQEGAQPNVQATQPTPPPAPTSQPAGQPIQAQPMAVPSTK